jgi:hypothetical protein
MQVLSRVVDVEDLDHLVLRPRDPPCALPDPRPAVAHKHDPYRPAVIASHLVHEHAQAVEEPIGVLQAGGVDARPEGKTHLVVAQLDLGPKATCHPDLHLAPLAASMHPTAIRPHQKGRGVVGQDGCYTQYAGALC